MAGFGIALLFLLILVGARRRIAAGVARLAAPLGFSLFERMVAGRYLRMRRGEGFIALVAGFSLMGIALGVATLIVVLAVMNGVRGELLRSIIGLDGHVTISRDGAPLTDYLSLMKKIDGAAGVVRTLPLVEGQVMASANGLAQGALVKGLRVEDLPAKPLLTKKIVEGSLEAFRQGEGVIIGRRMAQKMGLKLGDAVTLISPQGRATIAGMVPRIKAYPIVAIFEVGMFAYDAGLVLLPFEEAQIYFQLRQGTLDAVSGIEAEIEQPERAAQKAAQLARLLGEGYRVYDWQRSNSHILEAVMVQRNVMFLILTLIILVASFNIVSSLVMLVRSKQKDIAILRTMGATRGMVQRIFIACGMSIGLAGTFMGVILGLLIAFNTESIQRGLESLMGHELFTAELYFLSHLPSRVDPGETMMVIALSLALSFLTTLYPARRAASFNPAEALRHG